MKTTKLAAVVSFVLLLHAGPMKVQSGAAELDFDDMAKQMQRLNGQKQSKEVIALGIRYVNDPKNHSALFYNELGVAYNRAQNLDEAIRSYKQAIALKADFPDPYVNIGLIYVYSRPDNKKAAHYLNRYLRYADGRYPNNESKVRAWLMQNDLLDRSLK